MTQSRLRTWFLFLVVFGLFTGLATHSGSNYLNAQDNDPAVGTDDGGDKTPKEEKAKGLDERIDKAFKPVSDWWGGLVLTPVPFTTGSEKAEGFDKDGDGILSEAEMKAFAAANRLLIDETNPEFVHRLMAKVDKEKKYKGADSDRVVSLAEANELMVTQVPVVVILLVVGAGFFTVYFGFINLRLIPFAIQVVSGKYDDVEKAGAGDAAAIKHVEVHEVDGDLIDTIRDEGHGEVSHFQALATAVSGTVGLGNIAGVAVAIAVGGPGATFWMIICGLIGMSTKFVECTLGVKYRDVDENGTVHGGPMYYLKKGLGEMGLAPLGLALGYIFAVLCVGASFGGGNMFQANQAAQQIKTLGGWEHPAAGTIIGLIMAVIVAVVIIGGIKRIASITEKIVPLMAIIYVVAALIIILMNIGSIPTAISQIFAGAFTPAAGFGGLIGVLIVGFQRAAFSNEAGAGSAAIAHSAVKTNYPASEGIVALLEPFIDTVVICTMTALVIIMFNIKSEGDPDYLFQYGDVVSKEVLIQSADAGGAITTERVGGVDLTSRAFDSVLPGFKYVLTIAIILFAFSTMISWSYYGLQSWKFLFGRSKGADISYKVMFCIFIVIGAAASLGSVIDFSDAMILALVFPNMLGLLLLFPKVREELKRYMDVTRDKK